MGATAVMVEGVVAKARVGAARRIFRTVHLVLGLSFGLLLVSQGLSGATLVWRPELDRLMLPQLTHTAVAESGKASLNEEFAAVREAAPEGRVRGVRLAFEPGLTDEWTVAMPADTLGARDMNGGPRWTVYTSPATGKVVGIRGKNRDFLEFLVELHHSLLFGKAGRQVLGCLAVATILLALSGLCMWWPASWTPTRFRPRAAARPLHYAVGFWAMWPLLTLATTATYFVWRQPIQRLFGVAAPVVRDGVSVDGDGHARGGAHGGVSEGSVSLDSVIAAARGVAPTARLTMVRFPEGKGREYTVMFEAPEEHYRVAPNSIGVRAGADGSAKVETVSLWRNLPRAKRFLEWLPRIHQGEVGGPVVRVIWSLTGMMPAVLYVSGFLMWRRRLAVQGS